MRIETFLNKKQDFYTLTDYTKSVDSLLKERFGGDPITVSICMIVRDEDDNLTELLPQLSWADEIVIIDTNPDREYNEKRTKAGFIEAATQIIKYEWMDDYKGQLVFDVFPWVDDFAKARNYAKSKCTMDMIIWLDADDRLPIDTQKKLREELNQGREATKSTVHYLDVIMTDNGNPTGARISQPRLFPNTDVIKWEGKVHETIGASIQDMKSAIVTDIEILHTGYEDQELVKKKNERNLRLLLESERTPQVLMDLGNCYQNRGFFEKNKDSYVVAIAHYLKVLGFQNNHPDFNGHINYLIGVTYSMMGENEKALTYYDKSNKQDALYGKADSLVMLGREKDALEAYLEYINSEIKPNPYGSDIYKLRNNAYKQLIRILAENYREEYKFPVLMEAVDGTKP